MDDASNTSRGRVSKSIENLSTTAKSAKSKQLKLIKPKKSDLAKINFFKQIFLFPELKRLLYIYKRLLSKL